MVSRILALIVVAYFFSACTKTVHVLESEYSRLSLRDAVAIDVNATDGSRYVATSFWSTDSTLVLKKIRDFDYASSLHGGSQSDQPPALPFEVPWENVASIDAVEPDKKKSWIVGTTVFALGILVIYTGLSAANFGGGS